MDPFIGVHSSPFVVSDGPIGIVSSAVSENDPANLLTIQVGAKLGCQTQQMTLLPPTADSEL
jgi:hypothetical protein